MLNLQIWDYRPIDLVRFSDPLFDQLTYPLVPSHVLFYRLGNGKNKNDFARTFNIENASINSKS